MQLLYIFTAIIGLIVLYFLFKRLTRSKYSWYSTGMEVLEGCDLSKKTAIVTGANTGLGKETTRCLLHYGCRVIMACRSMDRGNKARDDIIKSFTSDKQQEISNRLVLMQLDLGDLTSVRSFATKYCKDNDTLDYLINNAGVMAIPDYRETKQGFEMQFGINHIGHSYLTFLLTDILIKSSPSRVIMLSSEAHMDQGPKDLYSWLSPLISEKRGPNKKTYDFMRNYGISKSSNIFFAREYNKEYYNKGISCFSLHPGMINTELARHANPLDVIKLVFGVFFTTGVFVPFNMKSIPQGVATTLRCVGLTENEVKQYNGWYFKNSNPANNMDGGLRNDHRPTDKLNKVTKQFYDLTKELIQNKGFKLNL